MSDLTSFARETERRVLAPTFESIVARHERERRRRALITYAAGLATVVALALGALALGRSANRVPATPEPVPTSVTVPAWSAEQVIGHPDAFVVTQLESKADRRIVLTVWKRCVVPRPDHDCLGPEAIAVVDGTDDRFLTLGPVTGSSAQPSLGSDGLFREVADGTWYWAHVDPGPYLLSPLMHGPLQLTVRDRPVAPDFGTSAVECADGAGLCALDVNARTLQRLALPGGDGVRWATPVAKGCGSWGLVGAGGDLRLVVQQPDGSFATADLPDDSAPTSIAEGGPACEVAYYEDVTSSLTELVVSLDQGASWQVRRATPPGPAGLIEQRPRLRVLIPPRWAALPEVPHPSGLPGRLRPL